MFPGLPELDETDGAICDAVSVCECFLCFCGRSDLPDGFWGEFSWPGFAASCRDVVWRYAVEVLAVLGMDDVVIIWDGSEVDDPGRAVRSEEFVLVADDAVTAAVYASGPDPAAVFRQFPDFFPEALGESVWVGVGHGASC